MPRKTITEVTFDKAQAACKAIDSELRVPDRDELAAMYINRSLLPITSGNYWSGSVISAGSSGLAWSQSFTGGYRFRVDRSDDGYDVRCVYK